MGRSHSQFSGPQELTMAFSLLFVIPEISENKHKINVSKIQNILVSLLVIFINININIESYRSSRALLNSLNMFW